MAKNSKSLRVILKFFLMALVCLMIVASGVAGMKKMLASKQAPAKKPPRKAGLFVKTMPVEKNDVSLLITGFGEAEPVETVNISPEVSGKIVRITSLKEGETIQKGAPLLVIDATDYKIAQTQAEIQVKLKQNQVKQLEVSFRKDKDRLAAVKQNTRLSKENWIRLKTLYENDRVGSLSTVESAEQSYNSLLDTEKTLKKAIELYPLQIQEAESILADARSNLETARLEVKRCVVTAAFTGRIKEIFVETGTYITKGAQAMVLADDSLLEIRISLSDKDAFELLDLDNVNGTDAKGRKTKPADCKVETVTGNNTITAAGFIHRIAGYDADTRTLTLAVRVRQDGGAEQQTSMKLMDGMFCRVNFKGKTMKDTVKIPGSILNHDNTIYIARDNRLKTQSVVKLMGDGDDIYIKGSFDAADRIIITSLSNPIENQVLNMAATGNPGGSEPIAFNRGNVQ